MFAGKVLCLLVAFLGMNLSAQAQADNLMIVKYVDWDSGSGVAIVVVNPTRNPVNLNNYEFRIYGNGSTVPTTTSALSGTLQPCGTILIANTEYINDNCPNTASINNFAPFSNGVNGNDVVAIALKTGQLIDAVGRIGFDPGNNNSQKVANVNDALYQRKLERTPTNLARYSLTSGTYNAGISNSANIWPNNSTTNVTGWIVSNSACITNSWNLSPVGVFVVAEPDKGRPCRSMQQFELTAIAGGGYNHTLQWSGGKGTFSNPTDAFTFYTPSPQDPYRIKFRVTLSSCGSSVFDEVIFTNGDSTLIPAGLTVSPPNPKIGDTVTFTLLSQSGNIFLAGNFNYGDGSPTENKRGQSKHVYKKSGTFEVKVASVNLVGCPSDTLRRVLVIPEDPVVAIPVEIIIPNIFTPNRDGRNDTYAPQLPVTTNYEMKIYNRWGGLVFESKDQNKNWDGKNAADGVYFMHLKAVLPSGELLNRKMPVTLVR